MRFRQLVIGILVTLCLDACPAAARAEQARRRGLHAIVSVGAACRWAYTTYVSPGAELTLGLGRRLESVAGYVTLNVTWSQTGLRLSTRRYAVGVAAELTKTRLGPLGVAMEGQLVAIEMQRFTHQQPMWAYGFGLYVTATYDMLVTTNGLTVFVGLRGGADFFAEGVWFWFMPGGTFLIGHRF